MTKRATTRTRGAFLNSAINADLLKRLKVAAIMRGERMQDIIERAIERELAHELRERNHGSATKED